MSARISKYVNRHFFWTGDTEPGEIARFCISVPKTDWFFTQFLGCLSLMSDENNWKNEGSVTPVDAASAAAAIIESVTKGGCEVIGELKWGSFKDGFEPENWLRMDGQAHLKADYPELFAASRHVYELSPTEFATFDFRGRALVAADEEGKYFEFSNTFKGQISVQLTTSTLSSHSHGIPNIVQIPVQAGAGAAALAYAPAGAPFSTSSQGGNSSHLNVQPSVTADLWIVAK